MKIEAKNLEKKFGTQTILHKFNLSIASGEMVCILGKSGSGKTTLLNILGLIEPKDSGEIFYNDECIRSKRQERRLLAEKIGFIFQNFALIENETVFENLNLIKQVRGKKKAEKIASMIDVLEQLGLDQKILYKKIYECSGGEQQRIAIAKILLKNCEIIFADEPTASLDYENKLSILRHLQQLHQMGKTIVIVSHDLEVCDYCDHIITIP